MIWWKNQVSISNIEEDMITLVISWRPFWILRFKKSLKKTHIRQDFITRMLEMHNQSRKNIYQPKQGYPPWLPDYCNGALFSWPPSTSNGSRAFECKKDQDFFIEIDRRYVYWLWILLSNEQTARVRTGEIWYLKWSISRYLDNAKQVFTPCTPCVS